jgi:hypothetical protein
MRVENQTKTEIWEDLILCPETSTKNAVQEFYLISDYAFLWPRSKREKTFLSFELSSIQLENDAQEFGNYAQSKKMSVSNNFLINYKSDI